MQTSGVLALNPRRYFAVALPQQCIDSYSSLHFNIANQSLYS